MINSENLLCSGFFACVKLCMCKAQFYSFSKRGDWFSITLPSSRPTALWSAVIYSYIPEHGSCCHSDVRWLTFVCTISCGEIAPLTEERKRAEPKGKAVWKENVTQSKGVRLGMSCVTRPLWVQTDFMWCFLIMSFLIKKHTKTTKHPKSSKKDILCIYLPY